jgi:hypothetical protein
MLILLAVVGGLGFLAYNAMKPKEGECWFWDLPCQAGKIGEGAGKAAGDVVNYITNTYQGTVGDEGAKTANWVSNLFTGNEVQYGTKKDLAITSATGEKSTYPNTTWVIGGEGGLGNVSGVNEGERLGLPSGLSPVQYCIDSYNANGYYPPICSQIEIPWYKKIPFVGGLIPA